jgi:hypothetical protein
MKSRLLQTFSILMLAVTAACGPASASSSPTETPSPLPSAAPTQSVELHYLTEIAGAPQNVAELDAPLTDYPGLQPAVERQLGFTLNAPGVKVAGLAETGPAAEGKDGQEDVIIVTNENQGMKGSFYEVLIQTPDGYWRSPDADTPLAPGEKYAAMPYVVKDAPDGSLIIGFENGMDRFVKDKDGNWKLLTLETAGGRQTALDLERTLGQKVFAKLVPASELATPTPEVKQYPICQVENFRDCPIPVEELFDGTYLRWLYTLSKPFDSAKIKNVPLQEVNGEIIYNLATLPNFTDPETAPFRRDVTFGYTEYKHNGALFKYIVMPVEYYDFKHPEQNQWVITVYSLIHSYDGKVSHATTEKGRIWDISLEREQSALQSTLNVWENEMNITPILTGENPVPYAPEWKSDDDPLVKTTFTNYPDMHDRFQRFVDEGDMTALSAPGIVLLTIFLESDIYQ